MESRFLIINRTDVILLCFFTLMVLGFVYQGLYALVHRADMTYVIGK